MLPAETPVPSAPEGDPIAGAAAEFEIPDFAADRIALADYEDAKKRYERQQIASAKAGIEREGGVKKEQIASDIRRLLAQRHAVHGAALEATRAYVSRYPRRAEKSGVLAPSFWEILFSFGWAWTLYKNALVACAGWDTLKVAIRKREAAVEELKEQIDRAVVLKEEALRKAFDTAEELERFHVRPEIREIFARSERVRLEREDYLGRLEAGEVSGEEQRARAMAEDDLAFTAIPIEGAIVARVNRYGPLNHFRLCDIGGKETLLSYDPRLDPLRTWVFDVYGIGADVHARLRRKPDGSIFRVAEHFKARFADHNKAEDLYADHRSALRRNRGLEATPPLDETETAIIEVLAQLAATVGAETSSGGEHHTPQVASRDRFELELAPGP